MLGAANMSTCKPAQNDSSIVLAGRYSSTAEAATKAHCSVPVCGVVTGVVPAAGGGDGAEVAPGQRLQDLAQKMMVALGALGGGTQKPVAACRHHTLCLQA